MGRKFLTLVAVTAVAVVASAIAAEAAGAGNTLTVQISGSGAVVDATADAAGNKLVGTRINCGTGTPGDCTETVEEECGGQGCFWPTIVLERAPGWQNARWTGCDMIGTLGDCFVTVSANKTVTVALDAAPADTVAPELTVSSPADGALLAGTVTISGSASDEGAGIYEVAAWLHNRSTGALIGRAGRDSRGGFAFSWNTTRVTLNGAAVSVPDGEYELRVIAYDNANPQNTAERRLDVTIANSPTDAAVAFTAPSEGALLGGGAHVVSASAAGEGASVAFEQRRADETSWTSLGVVGAAPYEVSWNTHGLNGAYRIRARVTASNGTTAVAERGVTVDSTAPTAVLTTPADGAVVGGTVTISADARDSGSGVASVLFEQRPSGGGAWTRIGAADTQAPFSAAWSVAGLTGAYELRVTVVDRAANSAAAAARTVTIDSTAPTAALTTPGEGAVVGGTVTVSAGATDGGSGVASVVFEQRASGGGAWTRIGAADNEAPYSAAWRVAGLSGTYELRATAVDRVGNSAATPIRSVTVDGIAPPAPSGLIQTSRTSSAVVIAWNIPFASDLASFRIYRDARQIDTAAPTSTSWIVGGLECGRTYAIGVTAVDRLGNESPRSVVAASTAACPATVDRVAPNTVMKGGPPRVTKSRIATFKFVSTEAGSRFQCKLDKGRWTACKSPKTYRKLKKGLHTFQVRAIDKAGNVDKTPAKRSWRVK